MRRSTFPGHIDRSKLFGSAFVATPFRGQSKLPKGKGGGVARELGKRDQWQICLTCRVKKNGERKGAILGWRRGQVSMFDRAW